MRPPPLLSSDRGEPEESLQSRRSETRPAKHFDCDVCGKGFEGEPAGSGLFLWTRGDEVRYEEPPLCEECAMKVSVGALLTYEDDEGEEG